MERAMPLRAGRSKAAIATAAVALLALSLAALAPTNSDASSHREAPLTAADPQIDNTDVYAFVSPDNPSTVTLISNWVPFQEPAGGPNFYPFGSGVRYDIKIDNDGDAKADIKYQWLFTNHYRSKNTFLYSTGQVESLTDPNLNFYQTYDLKKVVVGGSTTTLVNDGIAAPSHNGDAAMPDYSTLRDQAIESAGTGAKAFAGQTEDPFFLDLRVFDLLYGGDLSEVGDDTVQGFNVNTLALQIPKTELAKSGNPVSNPIIGVWSTASRRATVIQKANGTQTRQGPFVQVSRLGNPLVNEVVIPVGAKDRWNGSKPSADAQFLAGVTDPELARLLKAIYGVNVPPTPRNDLVAVFLTGVDGLNQPENVTPSEQLRLNMSIAPCEQGTCPDYSRMGVIEGDVAGFPNGRRLADDVLDIAVQVVAGELVGPEYANDLGDGVNTNDVDFLSLFPYVALPYSGSDTSPHDNAPSSSPTP